MTKKTTVAITKQPDTPLSKEQKQFNRLNSQIAREKDLLTTWQKQISEFKTIYSTEMTPLQKRHDQLRIQSVYLLDTIYENKIFTKGERKKILYIIEEVAQDIANEDEKVKEIYNRRGDHDYDQEQKRREDAAIDYMKATAAQELEIDLDNFEHIDNHEDLMQELLKHLQEQDEASKIKRDARKKSAKAIVNEAKLAKEKQAISQSIKEVYRQLASTLHPDRESDLAEQTRKTELMQQINIAYEKQDLITLLQMQLEIEQIDQSRINSLSIEKVKHYNSVLKKQLQEIKQEIYFIQERFQLEFSLPMFAGFTPDGIIRQIKQDIKAIAEEVKDLAHDLALWKDPKILKSYLKELQIQPRDTPLFPEWL